MFYCHEKVALGLFQKVVIKLYERCITFNSLMKQASVRDPAKEKPVSRFHDAPSGPGV